MSDNARLRTALGGFVARRGADGELRVNRQTRAAAAGADELAALAQLGVPARASRVTHADGSLVFMYGASGYGGDGYGS